tara:strand:+ start:35 stop:610 length:576 start_codon:yes stop_codon:yes gene_type:complete
MIKFPDKKYNIIYADPPWITQNWSEKGGKRGPKRHYQLMENQDIYNMPVESISEKDCILFLWVCFPQLDIGLETIKQWGFNYKTCGFVWVKTNKNYNTKQVSFLPVDSFDTFWGLGYWTRSNVELCLLATKGKLKKQSSSVHQLIYEPRTKHSQKPNCVRNKITSLVGDLPRIELFARQRHDGWDAWGNEV